MYQTLFKLLDTSNDVIIALNIICALNIMTVYKDEEFSEE